MRAFAKILESAFSRPATLKRSLTCFVLTGLSLAMPHVGLGQSSIGDKTPPIDRSREGIRLVPRTDPHAAGDLKRLRWLLSQQRDENGERDPLADYVPNPDFNKPSTPEERANRRNWKEDDEAYAQPKLFKKGNEPYASPNLRPESVGKINAVPTPSSAKPMTRVVVETIVDPCGIPIYARFPLKSAVDLADRSIDRSALQPAIPFDSQPVVNPALSGLGVPSGSVMPPGLQPGNPPVSVPFESATIGQTFPGTPIPGTPIPGTPIPGTPIPGTPIPGTPIPGTPVPGTPMGGIPSGSIGGPNPQPIVPSPSGAVGTPLSGMGGVVMAAPPPTYANPNPIVPPAAPPRYDTAPGIVTSQPFVTGPNCNRDARFMVSPTVYRQSVGCNNCGTPYAQSNNTPSSVSNPFQYIPPTYFPPTFAGFTQQFRPLFGLGQNIAAAQIGRGIIGQPVAYMPNQPLRNILRYLFP